MIQQKEIKNIHALYEATLDLCRKSEMRHIENYLLNHKDKPEIALKKMGIVCESDLMRFRRTNNIL